MILPTTQIQMYMLAALLTLGGIAAAPQFFTVRIHLKPKKFRRCEYKPSK